MSTYEFTGARQLNEQQAGQDGSQQGCGQQACEQQGVSKANNKVNMTNKDG